MCKLSAMLCILSLGCIPQTLHFATLWGCHREGFLFICSFFGLLLLKQGTRRKSGTARQIILHKSVHQRAHKLKKKTPPSVKKTQIEFKIELKPILCWSSLSVVTQSRQLHSPDWTPKLSTGTDREPGALTYLLSFLKHLL